MEIFRIPFILFKEIPVEIFRIPKQWRFSGSLASYQKKIIVEIIKTAFIIIKEITKCNFNSV